MNILTVTDNSYGLLFNHRRVSRDSSIRKKIIDLSKDSILWMDSYSAGQFTEGLPANARVSEDFLGMAADEDFCFVEDRRLIPYADKVASVYLFCWNRDYPSDFKLDFIPKDQGLKLYSTEDFKGSSHDNITLEVWKK